MYRVINGRSTGKTKQLLIAAKENNATVICSNPITMRSKAENYGLFGINFMSYVEFILNRDSWTENDNFYVDELENFIKTISHHSITGYTLTNED